MITKLALTFFLLINSLQAKVSYFTPKEDMPYELKIIYQSYNALALDKDSTSDQMYRFLEILLKNLSHMDREEILFLSKSEILKTILKLKPESATSTVLSGEFLRDLKSQLTSEEYNQMLPYSKWLLTSLLIDYEDLYKGKNRNQVTLKRLEMILPYLNYIRLNSLKDFDQMNHEVLLVISKKLVHFTSALLFYSSRLGAVATKTMLADISNQKPQEAHSDKSIESIIDPILEKHKKLGLPLPVDDWKPSETDYGLSTKPQSTESAKSAPITPENLPKPVDDWNVDDLL